MNIIYSHEKIALFSLALLTAIGGIYSYKFMSILLPILTFIVIYFEGGIKNISLQTTPPIFFLICLLFWIGLSIFWAENQVAALKAFVSLAFTFVFSFLFLSCIIQSKYNLISKAYVIVTFSGFFLMLFIVSQICIDTFFANCVNYKGVPYMLRMKPTGSIIGLTSFVSCAFLGIYKNKTLSIFIFILLSLLVLLTLCQTAFYAIILGSLIFCSSYLMPFWITRIGMIFSYTFLLLSPIFYTHILPSEVLLKATYFKWLVNPSFFHRWLAWEYYSNKFFEKPLLGWGVESSRYLPTEPELAPGFTNALHPHNNSIQAYVELGLIGGILYSLFFASLFYLVEKKVKDRLSVAVCNATLTYGFISAEFTHNAWRNYWLSLSALTAGLVILFIKAREEQLHVPACHLKQPLTQ